jgi:hypothetical protein
MTGAAGSAAGKQGTAPRRRKLLERLAGLDDGAIIRTAFFSMLAGTAAVLYVDFGELNLAKASTGLPGQPIVPQFDPFAPRLAPGPAVTTDRALLDAPLMVSLEPGGVLALTGTLDLGAAERVQAEIAARGEYVKTVSLNSPGGSVGDALAIGAMLRKSGFATSVEKGALCASSCPLMLAGGVTRLASAEAAIGVHQIYAAETTQTLGTLKPTAATAMADAQRTTAEITRYLNDMGIDPGLWLHALETPPGELYFLKPNELKTLRLVTGLI